MMANQYTFRGGVCHHTFSSDRGEDITITIGRHEASEESIHPAEQHACELQKKENHSENEAQKLSPVPYEQYETPLSQEPGDS